MKISRFSKLTLLAGFASGLQPSLVLAAVETPSIGANEIFHLGTGLVVVVGVILLCGWVYLRTQGPKRHAGEVFNVVASQALGPKERILLVEVANKQLVIGMTASQVQTLHVFDEPIVEEVERSAPLKFSERLKSALVRK